MPDFDKFFYETPDKFIEYNGKRIFRYDEIPFSDGDKFIIRFESTNSEWRQGLLLFVFGTIKIGEIAQERAAFFEDKTPKEIVIQMYQDKSKRAQPKKLPLKGRLGVKNVLVVLL